jgi:hypothetical protein
MQKSLIIFSLFIGSLSLAANAPCTVTEADSLPAMVKVDKASFIDGKGYLILMDHVQAQSPTGKNKVCVNFQANSSKGTQNITAYLNPSDLMYIDDPHQDQWADSLNAAISKFIMQKSMIAKCGDDYTQDVYEGFSPVTDGPHDSEHFYIQTVCSHGAAGYDGPTLIFEVIAKKQKPAEVKFAASLNLNGNIAYDTKSGDFLVEDLASNKAGGCYTRNRRQLTSKGLSNGSTKIKVCYGQ